MSDLTILTANGDAVDLTTLDVEKLVDLGKTVYHHEDLAKVIHVLWHHIQLRDDALAVQGERLRAGLREVTASEYLLAVRNAGAGDQLVAAREAVERAMAAYPPNVGVAALANILLLRVLEGR